jgi:hypothetical protein
LPTAAAAREMSVFLRRYYASAWRRLDCMRDAPPESYIGMPAELYFRVCALSGDKLPGEAAIRKIIAAAGKILALENSSVFALASRPMEKPLVTYIDAKLAATVKAMPGFRQAEARAVEAEIAERSGHIEALKQLDEEATKAFAPQEKRRAAAIARVRQAERDLHLANVELGAVVSAIDSERRAYTVARREHEGALITGADWSAIDAFWDEAMDEYARTQKAVQTYEVTTKNRVTGRVDRQSTGNGRRIKARLRAIMESVHAAPALRLELADPRELPARLAAFKAAWPPVEDVALLSAGSDKEASRAE